jgi:hypothetical protein
VPGILSGFAAVGLLVAVGRWLLRKWLLPVRKVKLPPSGATPWERVRPTSPQKNQDGAGYWRQPLPTTDAFIPITSINLPSLSSTTGQDAPQWQARLSTRHLFEANAIESHPYGRHASSTQEQQCNPSQLVAPMRERERAKNAEEMR